MKILIVEDDSETIESLTMVFRLRWPETNLITTTYGEKGVELAQRESPDLIILDVGLPDIDGFAVLRRVREFCDTPVIILTVRGDEINKIKGLELGADDYMVKPFSPGELLARAKTVIRRFEKSEQMSISDQKPFIRGKIRIDTTSREVNVHGKSLKLSPRAYDMLVALVENEGEFVPFETLKKAVAAPGEQIKDSFVAFFIKDLNEKLGDATGLREMIIGEQDRGYKLITP